MAHDPVADAALGQLRDMLQRYLQVADVLGAAVDALEEHLEAETETPGPPAQETNEAQADVEKRHELQTILAFQQRLSEVFGVATVTLEGSGEHGFRFLVEMANPAY